MDNKFDSLVINKEYLYEGVGFSEKLPTGIVTLDIALGGGIPLNGSIIEVYGEESNGKTTISLRFCKSCTDHESGYVTWVDSETSYDDAWARIQGVNTSKLIPYRPPYMEAANDLILQDIKKYKEVYLPWLVDHKWSPSREQADAAGCGMRDHEGVKRYMKENAPPHIIVWDSLAASPVKGVAEGSGEFSEGMAYRARLIKQFLSRYNVAVVGCDKISLVLINQVIDKIGSWAGGVTTPGGRGLRHGKHLSIYVKKSGSGTRDWENFQLTDYVMLSITKNKVTPVISSFPVIFSKAKGYIGATSILEYLRSLKWFKDAGSWKKFDYILVDPETGEVTHSETVSFQLSNFYTLMEERPELLEYLCNVIKNLLLERFPTNRTLKETDIHSIIEACLKDSDISMPDTDEVNDMTKENN